MRAMRGVSMRCSMCRARQSNRPSETGGQMPAHERFQLTAARRRLDGSARALLEHAAVSTHSRPKAAGALCGVFCAGRYVSTHSRPKAAGWGGVWIATQAGWFQLTAARRRLGQALKLAIGGQLVSTHSRPKAAGPWKRSKRLSLFGFNSQPPEGGWF